jgi:hypothetical protein
MSAATNIPHGDRSCGKVGAGDGARAGEAEPAATASAEGTAEGTAAAGSLAEEAGASPDGTPAAGALGVDSGTGTTALPAGAVDGAGCAPTVSTAKTSNAVIDRIANQFFINPGSRRAIRA